LWLEHVQTDLFVLMTVNGSPYGASLIFFVRSAAWALVYMPIAAAAPELRNLRALGLFWLAGDVVATVLAVVLTAQWRWWDAVKALPGAQMRLPHRHGTTPLYLNDVVNTGFVYIDRYMIGLFLSHEMLGVYTFFSSITNAMGNLIGVCVVQTRKGDLIQAARAGPPGGFHRLLRSLTVTSGQMTAALSLLAIAAMYVAVPFVQRRELMTAMPVMYVLCAGLVMRVVYEVIGICFYAYSRDDIAFYSGLAILAIALGLNLILVPVAGVWGAGLVLLASYAIGAVARGLIISRGFRRPG
jgi:O-antigen/teichoic acid export membrane protein